MDEPVKEVIIHQDPERVVKIHPDNTGVGLIATSIELEQEQQFFI